MSWRQLKPLMFTLILGILPWDDAVACGCPCWQAAWNGACEVCSGSSQGAFEAIEQALDASEELIMTSLGENDYSGSVGFPALNDTIEGAVGTQTSNLQSMLTAMTNELTQTINEIAPNRHKLATEMEKLQDEVVETGVDGCRQVNYGTTSGLKGRSSLKGSMKWLRGLGVYVHDNVDGVESEPNAEPEITKEQANAAIVANPSDTASFSIKTQLDELKERSGNPNASAAELLKPELLVSASNRVLSDQPSEDNISDSERMDTLLTVMNANRPSTGEILGKTATGIASLKQATRENINNMEMSIPMAVVDKLIRARRPLPASLGTEDYLREVMGDQSPDNAVSADDFVYLTTHYRPNDVGWVNKVSVNSTYAMRQYTQMEAEALAIKYRRWVFKRDTNLMLAQILANTLQED